MREKVSSYDPQLYAEIDGHVTEQS